MSVPTTNNIAAKKSAAKKVAAKKTSSKPTNRMVSTNGTETMNDRDFDLLAQHMNEVRQKPVATKEDFERLQQHFDKLRLHASGEEGIRLEATGTPAAPVVGRELTGDLAQTSIGPSGSQQQVLGLMDWTVDWKVATVESNTTDNFGYEYSLPSNASWTVKASYAYLQQDTSQISNVRSVITSLVRKVVQWNFFTGPNQGDDSYYGNAFIESVSFGAGTKKLVKMDISLRGVGPLFEGIQLAPTVVSTTATGLQAQN